MQHDEVLMHVQRGSLTPTTLMINALSDDHPHVDMRGHRADGSESIGV